MKIVTWNCNGAFRNKLQEIEKLDADIYVIQECENPEHSTNEYKQWAKNYFWIGDSKHKGLGIFAKGAIDIQRLDWEDDGLQLFLPVIVNNSFNLVGVWTKHANSHSFRYIGQLWKYLQLHKAKLTSRQTVLCGDLNSNKIWDVRHRISNHSDVVRELNEIDIVSIYHAVTGEEQGLETAPTLYLQKNLQKPYHIDYAFSSKDIINKNSTVTIGNHIEWLKFSDHVPVTFSISCQ